MTTTMEDKVRTNINDLTAAEKKALIKAVYAKQSYFEQLFASDHKEFACKAIATKLRNEIERLLIAKKIITTSLELESLHTVLSDDMKTYNFNDGVNQLTTHFYENDSAFLAVYYDFIRHIRNHIVLEPFWFQATPTIRLHCPDGKNNNHYPRYHTDVGYGHPPEEFNIWLPLTYTKEGHCFRTMPLTSSNRLLAEFDYDFERFIDQAIHNKAFTQRCETESHPVRTEFGNMLMFDSRCVHTGEPMKNHTRVSIDIRILPLSQYEKMNILYQGTGRRKIIFAPGQCYHEKSSDYFLNNKGI